ncbi:MULTISPECIES: hypothetical protein [unclassified Streptomyces]|uniref:hypothetical protein n=1 Tax=unclassified Streptomyces TaxID=2593676 RepID=UPI00224E80B2|nr:MULTISPECIES: hypothetical protein [unclassified Streptomyces]MCX5048518.1 hypothetical protein [Streptomyces sp. NBC_00474]
MSRICAISAALGLALAAGLATASSAVAAPEALHTATTVQSIPSDHGGWDGWDDGWGGDCNGNGNINICA